MSELRQQLYEIFEQLDQIGQKLTAISEKVLGDHTQDTEKPEINAKTPLSEEALRQLGFVDFGRRWAGWRHPETGNYRVAYVEDFDGWWLFYTIGDQNEVVDRIVDFGDLHGWLKSKTSVSIL